MAKLIIEVDISDFSEIDPEAERFDPSMTSAMDMALAVIGEEWDEFYFSRFEGNLMVTPIRAEWMI